MMSHQRKSSAHAPTASAATTGSGAAQSDAAPAATSAVADVDSSDDEGDMTSSNFFSMANDDIVHDNPLSASSLSVTSSVSTLPGVGTKEAESQKSGIPDTTLQDQPLSFKQRDGFMQDSASAYKRSVASYPQATASCYSKNAYSNAQYNMAADSSALSDDTVQQPLKRTAAFEHDEEVGIRFSCCFVCVLRDHTMLTL